MPAHELHLLPSGTLALARSTIFRGETDPTEELLHVYAALIRTDDGDILFDTGLDPAAAKDPSVLGTGARLLRSFTQDDDVRARLRAAGTSEDRIAAVVPSHFHFDHIGALRYFTRSKVYVQSAELRAARFPDLRTGTPNRALWDHPLDYQPIAGDTEIVPGVWAIATPGHTPGHQSLAVRLQETGLVILTGDAAYTWENVKQQRPSSNAWDLQLALESLRKLSAWERLAEVAIIPSHDPALWRWAHPHPFVYR